MNDAIKVRLYDIRSITLLFVFEIICFIISIACAMMSEIINIASMIFAGLFIVCFISQLAIYLYGYNKHLLFYPDRVELNWKNTKIVYDWKEINSLSYYSFADIIVLKNFTMDMWIFENGINTFFEKKYCVIPMTYKKFLKIVERKNK